MEVLFCQACGTKVTCSSGSIEKHCGLGKNDKRGHFHKAALEKFNRGEKRREQAFMSLLDYNLKHPEALQSTLPVPMLHKRMKTLGAFLTSGTPLSRLPHFKAILEEGSWNVGSRQSMAELIPRMLRGEVDRLKTMFADQYITAFLDGTSLLEEGWGFLCVPVIFYSCCSSSLTFPLSNTLGQVHRDLERRRRLCLDPWMTTWTNIRL